MTDLVTTSARSAVVVLHGDFGGEVKQVLASGLAVDRVFPPYVQFVGNPVSVDELWRGLAAANDASLQLDSAVLWKQPDVIFVVAAAELGESVHTMLEQISGFRERLSKSGFYGRIGMVLFATPLPAGNSDQAACDTAIAAIRQCESLSFVLAMADGDAKGQLLARREHAAELAALTVDLLIDTNRPEVREHIALNFTRGPLTERWFTLGIQRVLFGIPDLSAHCVARTRRRLASLFLGVKGPGQPAKLTATALSSSNLQARLRQHLDELWAHTGSLLAVVDQSRVWLEQLAVADARDQVRDGSASTRRIIEGLRKKPPAPLPRAKPRGWRRFCCWIVKSLKRVAALFLRICRLFRGQRFADPNQARTPRSTRVRIARRALTWLDDAVSVPSQLTRDALERKPETAPGSVSPFTHRDLVAPPPDDPVSWKVGTELASHLADFPLFDLLGKEGAEFVQRIEDWTTSYLAEASRDRTPSTAMLAETAKLLLARVSVPWPANESAGGDRFVLLPPGSNLQVAGATTCPGRAGTLVVIELARIEESVVA
ncbi:MAG: hypothetical protein GY944_04500 [bacterium]|nr:hypothetical protein [bacterium]